MTQLFDAREFDKANVKALVESSFEFVYVNSEDRLSGTHENFSFQIKHDLTNFTRVALMAASIPKTYYLIDTGNDTFVLREFDGDKTITLDHGTYSRSTFATNLQTKINAAATGTYTITFPTGNDPEDGKFTFTRTGGTGTAQPSIVLSNDELYEQLGFDRNSTNTFASDILKSTNVIKMQVEDIITIRSDLVANEGQVLQQMYTGNYLAFSFVAFVNQGMPFYTKKLGSKKGNVYQFKITDENGRLLILNGLNVEFTLVFF